MQTIYLDISNKGAIPCIQAKQSEVGRKFLAVITDNGVPYNIPDNSLLSVWYEGDTDAGNYSSIEEKSAFSIDGNKVTVELVAQMLLKPGKGELCLSVTHGDGGETNTWNIPYEVEYKPGAGSAVPTEYYTALTDAAARAAEQVALATEQAENAAEKAEEVKNLVSQMSPVDISNNISFDDPYNDGYTVLYVNYAYYFPTIKMVFYNYGLRYDEATLRGIAGGGFEHTGGYKPKAGDAAVVNNSADLTAKYYSRIDRATFFEVQLANNDALAENSKKTAGFMGWYFCNGE